MEKLKHLQRKGQYEIAVLLYVTKVSGRTRMSYDYKLLLLNTMQCFDAGFDMYKFLQK